MLNLHPLSLWSFVLAALSLIGIVILTVTHNAVPDTLTNALYVTLGAGGASGLVAAQKTTN